MRSLLSRQARRAATWWIRSRHPELIFAAARLRRAALASHQRVTMVVGSYGKTTTVRAIRAALGLPATLWSELNANTLGEVAWSALRDPPWRRNLVVEAAAAIPGQIAWYASALRPHSTVVTCLGHEHIRAFGSLEALRDEKAAAIRALPPDGTAILNGDDSHVRWMATQTKARVKWYGTTDDCQVRASRIEMDWPHGTKMQLHVGRETCAFRTRLIGRRMVHCALAAVAVATESGRSLSEVASALAEFSPTRGRLQPVVLSSGAIVIRDEYKATPETVYEALQVLAQAPAQRRVVVIGSLNNLPSTPIEPHYEAAAKAIGEVADLVMVVGSRINEYLPGFRRAGLSDSQIVEVANVHDAITYLRADLRSGDVMLLKGLEDERLSRIVLGLLGEDVRCTATTCRAYLQFCDDCPLLRCPNA